MRPLLLSSSVAVALVLQLVPASPLAAQEPAITAELTPETWDQLVPSGKEVDAIYGDMVLQNSHLRAVIAQPKSGRNANMTVRDVGGCLIDLVTRTHQSDALAHSIRDAGNRYFLRGSQSEAIQARTRPSMWPGPSRNPSSSTQWSGGWGLIPVT